MAKPTGKKAGKSVKAPARKPAPTVRLAEGARRPARLGGLGRGLDALLGRAPADLKAESAEVRPAAAAEAQRRTVVDVPVALIRRSPWQPRRFFDEEALSELADSISAHGIVQPLACRRKDGFFELIGGERRLRAAQKLGMETVPVLLVDAPDRDAAEIALVENLQREDLNVIEEAEGYKALADEFKLTQGEIAERVGKARASVANTMRLLELPDELKQLLGEGLLSTGHAKVLLGVEDDGARTQLGRECIEEGLTVRALERRIASRAKAPAHRVRPATDIPPDYVKTLADKIGSRFSAPVRVVPSVTYANGRHGRGRLEIDFFGNDDLSRLLDLLGVDVNE
ncbi:MAG: ParB/RepB/Spo0J family partition protein [Kiritimatiellae bacterium]|nr:ParB/RepB/Spo0J family partition protein [Kiritimatiellia bacterium]